MVAKRRTVVISGFATGERRGERRADSREEKRSRCWVSLKSAFLLVPTVPEPRARSLVPARLQGARIAFRRRREERGKKKEERGKKKDQRRGE